MNRELRTKIPSITGKKQVDDGMTKEKYKQYANTRRKAKKKNL
jgi:hypothetical protein